ncbi:hypothetical protein Poli38472_011441 [Pythium oligandrum]|uniref:BTB domain-containing protein n=1 Tax=Pythium oligandrum TaxID=41045 RepID=A0A8K1FJ57_PYTOL|nr:hypothetical protein Poli38472_011441 [Pythium oligandrum]|eukprot:TMW64561.1 hypothetical protein Poli38472_011441 [Pythium oligandrum]
MLKLIEGYREQHVSTQDMQVYVGDRLEGIRTDLDAVVSRSLAATESRLEKMIEVYGEQHVSSRDVEVYVDRQLSTMRQELETSLSLSRGHSHSLSETQMQELSGVYSRQQASLDDLRVRVEKQSNQLTELMEATASQPQVTPDQVQQYLDERLIEVEKRLDDTLTRRCEELLSQSEGLMQSRLDAFEQRLGSSWARIVAEEFVLNQENFRQRASRVLHVVTAASVTTVEQHINRYMHKILEHDALLDTTSQEEREPTCPELPRSSSVSTRASSVKQEHSLHYSSSLRGDQELSNDMSLYAWGTNTTQQLGLDDDAKEVFDVSLVTALQGHVLVDFSAGVQHSLAVNEFGEVLAWGRGKDGQLGLGTRGDQVVRHPERVTALDGHIIKKVSCGDTHSIALSSTGEVFMWGLLPETRTVKNDGMFDHASVSLTGLQTEQERDTFSDFMSRLLSGSEELYEAQNLTKHDVDDSETSLAHLGRKKMQTVRHPTFVPRLSVSLAKRKITNIAAGFAHSLAVSSDGVVFSCGYNDNGQLGIGSRRNTADFERVKGLDGYFITQIACGQQHSMACTPINPADPKRSGICFSWGLGILGQLGLGINISWLPMEVNVDKPVVSIAAGSHHSVAATTDGKVYTWGHSEYGQHGAGERYNDLQRGLYYFFPRLQESLDSQGVLVDKVACSSHSTFALSRDGRVFSWGWNAFGILGNGKYQHTVHPQHVMGLKDNVAVHVSAGANHCAVIVRPRGCHYSLQYDKVLADGKFCDIGFKVAGGSQLLKAHQVVLCARSGYLRGLLRVLRSAMPEPEPTNEEDDESSLFVVEEFSDVDIQVFRAFLLFLYTNRVEIASHKRRALLEFATRVCVDELAAECEVVWRKERPLVSELDERQLEMTQFERDMQEMVLSPTFADVEFLWPKRATADEDEETKESEEPVEFERLPAHKAVLSQVDYFHTMFAGGFSEGRVVDDNAASSSSLHQIALQHMPNDGISLSAFKALLTWIYTGSVYLLQQLEPNEMMDLYVAASLMSLNVLANLCEMQLIKILPSLQDDLASLQACVDFATQFDARRLKTLSTRALKTSQGITTTDEFGA